MTGSTKPPGKLAVMTPAVTQLKANHMEGMQGATATIDSATETTVYMVDFTSSTGEQVTNHMWVTKDELSK